jgi:hypothetical protein
VSDPWVTENIGMVDGWRTWEQGEWHLVWIGLSTKTIITLHFSSFSLEIFFFFFCGRHSSASIEYSRCQISAHKYFFFFLCHMIKFIYDSDMWLIFKIFFI